MGSEMCIRDSVRANEMLKEYPQDSRFPLVSLATHHWVTWILYKRLKGQLPEAVYVVRLSIPEPSFHRLKEKREFFQKRRAFLMGLSMRLRELDPLKIGDDLYVLLSSKKDVDNVVKEVADSGIPCDLDVYAYFLEEVFEVEGLRLQRPQIRVKDYVVNFLSVGVGEDWTFYPGEKVEWIKYLEFPDVAWISLKPLKNLHESAEEFLKWAEENVLSKAEFKKPEKVPLTSEVPSSPELLISVAQGYEDFLDEFIKMRTFRDWLFQ